MNVQARGSRRSWILALGAAIGLSVGALAAGEMLEWPFLRAPLQDALAKALQRPVRLEAPFGVRLLGSVRLRAGELVVGPPADAAAQPDLLHARAVRLELPYATLWQAVRERREQPIQIDALSVDHLEAHLLRDAEGRANWRFDRATQPAATPAVTPNTEPGLAWPHFGLLQVGSGEIHLEDLPSQLSLQASVRTHEGAAPDPSGRPAAGLEVQARGQHRGLPLSANLQSSGVLPLIREDDGAAAAAVAVPIRLDLRIGRARLTLDGRASDVVHLGGLDAAFDLAGPSLAAVGNVLGLTLPTTAAFEMRGRLRKQGQQWAADVAAWRVGSSRLRGEFRYDTRREPPRLAGTLAGERLALADLGPVIGTRPDGTPDKTPPGRVLPRREFDIPSLRRMDADVMLQLDRLDLGTPRLESMAPLQGRVRLQGGVLGVQDLLARTSNGSVRGGITVDARSQASPLWRADLRWDGIDLERFVKVRNPRAASAPAPSGEAPAAATARAPGYISGQLAGAAKVTGHGRSIAAVFATLDGSAGLWVRDGRVSHLLVELAGIDLAESLGLLVTGDRSLPLRCAVTQLSLRNGRALPQAALVDTRDTTLVINGEVSLAEETLALVVTAQPHDMSPVALRTPLRIDGSFAQPRVRLDKGRIALRLAGAGALALVLPPAALLALVDFGEDDRQRCGEAIQDARVRKPAR